MLKEVLLPDLGEGIDSADVSEVLINPGDSISIDDIILVLDATSGQNIINQVNEFNKIIPITGIIMTKLDGTAKGGILIALAQKFKLPIIALWLGEKIDDLQIFDSSKFADAFLKVS